MLAIIILGLASVIFLLLRKKPEQNNDSLLMLQQQINQVNQAIDGKLSESARMMQAQLSEGSKMIQDVTEKLTNLDRTNQQVIGFSEQLNDLRKILTNQKQRGNLGEAGLQLVLENILPPNGFSLQYQFKDGDKVDAVIFTKEGMIPVDAKFSLDNYDRLVKETDDEKRAELEKEFKIDLKKRIDETAKYIKPREGTLEFAFMFIPAEAIYYDLLVNEVGAVKVNTRSLIDYAFSDKKVIIVSPTTFAAYLLTVLQGLRAFKIEESAKSIRRNVEALGKHINAYQEFMQKLGLSLGITVNHYNKACDELVKIDKDVVRIAEVEPTIEVKKLEKPKSDTEINN